MNVFTYGREACKYFADLYGKSEYGQFLRYDKLIRNFKKYFRLTSCHLISSPGRVEVIGNHTDHNGGKVIGCAVNLDTIGAFISNDSRRIRIKSDKHSLIEFCVDDEITLKRGFGLAHGVTEYLKNAGYAVGGFDVYTNSVLPSGAGVSSSASFEMLVAEIINESFNDGRIPVEILARAGQYAENVCLNKPCGLLDQGAVLSGGLTEFDFKNGFVAERLNSVSGGFKFVLVDTGFSHSNLPDLYASIPSDMRAVALNFGKDRLIDVDESAFMESYGSLCNIVGTDKTNRALHFFDENARVTRFALTLENGDVREITHLINASGDSSINLLRNCAVDENDTAILDAVNFARTLGNVGARVHGGGFAGTVLCVIPDVSYNVVFGALCERYGAANVLPMRVRSVGTAVL